MKEATKNLLAAITTSRGVEILVLFSSKPTKELF